LSDSLLGSSSLHTNSILRLTKVHGLQIVHLSTIQQTCHLSHFSGVRGLKALNFRLSSGTKVTGAKNCKR
jgi:hypothetical protein